MKLIYIFILSSFSLISAQTNELNTYNILWNTQSENSNETMPCGGGDIGLNVWVENGDILFYIARSGTFDEHNTMLKLGRVRIRLNPNPFNGDYFYQELKLSQGNIEITGANHGDTANVLLWVDVARPVIHVEINANHPVQAKAFYESWRYADRSLRQNESFSNSYKWAPPENLQSYKDEIMFMDTGIVFFHRNKEETIFDVTVYQQGLGQVKPYMFNPLRNLTFGGKMVASHMSPADTSSGKYLDTEYKAWALQSKQAQTNYHIKTVLQTSQPANINKWFDDLNQTILGNEMHNFSAYKNSLDWWKDFWERSFIIINPENPIDSSIPWQIGRNYQLFRYMLGCNAYGKYPTKFNGGLFTYDPRFDDPSRSFTPDYRNWGGGTFTAQNQRLVYFPMLKSGDFDLMKPQFEFYLRSLINAELRSKVYWGHAGACFTEQLENFGLPNCSEYGWHRPEDFERGLQYNAWLEYQWDTSLEICFMILEMYKYTKKNIQEYVPLIKSCLTFFNEHYIYMARKRGIKELDENGKLVLYPGSACETYKMAYNSTSTIAALKVVLHELLALSDDYLNQEEKEYYTSMQDRIPDISFRDFEGHTTIAPAKLWERINNTEVPQLYPVFPWGLHGINKSDFEIALNTWKYDKDAIKFRGHTGWKQDNIFAARLGLAEEAFKYTALKLNDSGRRFPAFWGPGFDWVPDHNQGGSGMIGLQEMLLQVNNEKIYLLPAWPKDLDVYFKLYAPDNTTVELYYKDGVVKKLKVIPEQRKKDVVNLLHEKIK